MCKARLTIATNEKRTKHNKVRVTETNAHQMT